MLRLSCLPPWSKHTLVANAPEEEGSLERKNGPALGMPRTMLRLRIWCFQ